jgi:hypothetical protein
MLQQLTQHNHGQAAQCIHPLNVLSQHGAVVWDPALHCTGYFEQLGALSVQPCDPMPAAHRSQVASSRIGMHPLPLC